ncbi:MAG: hypothetical protein BSOLF_0542 [Candidatus Carbobacillus altaicus]|uniref:Uncharacterized protein n=1 Tax=Candidatus Carbonibacillus altaicus TaxID=2163959 RepID=A0A2R6Y0V4_9BACL|nr:MAG: hypothetical protein BSOLF_0542 [Candidatus Carbobacillus altaicus]
MPTLKYSNNTKKGLAGHLSVLFYYQKKTKKEDDHWKTKHNTLWHRSL